MNAIGRTFSVLFLLLSLNVLVTAQRVAPPPPPQTPRQALIEIINGGDKSLMKHLTIEVQQLLSQSKYKQGQLFPSGMFGALRSQPGVEVETFETGPVLLSVNSPKEHQKFEINVNTDDLRGDQDALELSFHMYHEGEEQEPEWQPFLTHFALTMVKQKEIWRLSKIAVGAEFLIGDAEFLKKTVFKGADKDQAARAQEKHDDSQQTDVRPEPADMPAEQVVMMLGYAEASFAHQHPDVGFTCSLADLADSAKQFGLEQPVTGSSYKGYRLNLTGCQGKPAGSFQLTAEPMATGKAYCTDATHNLRMSDDGRGSTCLMAGRSPRSVPVEEEEVVTPGSDAPPDKPPEQ